MAHALWGVLLLSLATTTQVADARTGATAPQQNAKATESRANPTSGHTKSAAHTTTSKKSTAGTSESYKADMAECRRMDAAARRGCEREVHAARAEGLYRE